MRNKIRRERHKLIIKTLKERDYYIEELRIKTKIPRTTLERYLKDLEKKKIIKTYRDGPLVKVKLVGNNE